MTLKNGYRVRGLSGLPPLQTHHIKLVTTKELVIQWWAKTLVSCLQSEGYHLHPSVGTTSLFLRNGVNH